MASVTDLVASITDMFPKTPVAYIEEQCKDLLGKPAAIEK